MSSLNDIANAVCGDLFAKGPPVEFKGETLDPKRDGKRLGDQLQRVFNVTACGQWMTLARISLEAGAPEASCSARLRDLRRMPGFSVERRYVESGLWEYRVLKT